MPEYRSLSLKQSPGNPIQRVDLNKLKFGYGRQDMAGATQSGTMAFRWKVIPLTVLLCIVQTIITVSASNLASQYPTSTLITVIGLGFLLILIMVINPLLRFIFRNRVRPLGRVELMAIIASLTITAGISTFGLSDALVPLIAAPWNSEWNTPQSGWSEHLHPYLRHELYITDPSLIKVFREGVHGQPMPDATWGQWAVYYQKVITEIPWKAWLGPLGFWMIFILGCYGLFWSLSYLVLDLWYRQEKLIFPLAKLSEAMLPIENSKGDIWPAMVKKQLFWAGFLLSFSLLIYNAAASVDLIPMVKLTLGMGRGEIDAMFRQSFLSGLVGSGTVLIIFTCIGIAFFLPLEISFSIWFYFLVSRVLILCLVSQGHGQNFHDFPSDMAWVQNPVATLGMGGMLVFSCFVLWRVLPGLFQKQQASSSNPVNPWLRRLPMFGTCVSFIVVSLWLSWNHLPLGWAIFVTAFLVLLTLGIMRIVAESGVFWIQSNASFFHLYKMFGLSSVLSATLVAPLLMIYSTLFFDIKTFIAPSILNSAKLREEVGGSRLKFHLNVAISVIVSMVVAIGYSLILAYSRGAQQMNTWFYSNAPKHYCQQAANASTMNFRFESANVCWLAGGAIWMVLTFMLRRSYFWFPHPVGFLMNINPLIQYLWFSFFLGWLCKKIVLKYGGKLSYEPTRQLMMGLIFGELFAIFIVGTANLLPLNLQITGIDLNRYGP